MVSHALYVFIPKSRCFNWFWAGNLKTICPVHLHGDKHALQREELEPPYLRANTSASSIKNTQGGSLSKHEDRPLDYNHNSANDRAGQNRVDKGSQRVCHFSALELIDNQKVAEIPLNGLALLESHL